MTTFNKILAILAIVALIFLLARTLRANPEMTSKENLGKSFGTLGVLGLALIAFIGLLVLWLRSRS